MKLPAALAFVAFSLSLFAVSGTHGADQMESNINVGKLQQEIRSHEEMIVKSGEQEHSLLDDLEQLDDKIGKQQKKITELQHQIHAQETIIAAQLAKLNDIKQKNESLRKHLTQRLKAFYLMGKGGFLNVTFSSKALPDLLLSHDAFHKLITYDESVFQAYRESMGEIERAKQAHELEKTVLEKFLEDADTENAALNETAEQKNGLLKRVQAQKGLYQQALKEMKKAEDNLTTTLTKLNKAQEQRLHGFLRSKGKLPPPVLNGRITSRFHDNTPNLDTTFANGITLSTPEKTEARAVYGGAVIFSGSMRGYGNMVIIDHDLQYYTVTARFDQILVREGDLVTQGQVLGTTGELATLFGKGLYFEIRHGSTAEDPLLWLRPDSLDMP